MSSALTDLIAAARDQGRGGTPADEDRWSELADAAEKELAAKNALVAGLQSSLHYALHDKPRIDLEALRKALEDYLTRSQIEHLLAQLEGAKGQPKCDCFVRGGCPSCNPGPYAAFAPKPEAQTCVDPTCTRHHFDQCSEDCALLRKTRGKCYHEAQTCPTCKGYGDARFYPRPSPSQCDDCDGTGKVGGGQ